MDLTTQSVFREELGPEGEMIGPGPCLDNVWGPLNLTPHDAGIFSLVMVIALGVVGLVCILVIAVACGYAAQVSTLRRKLRDLEMGQKSKKNGGPGAMVYSELNEVDLPPPPPETPLPGPPDVNDNESDVKPPVLDSPSSSVVAAAEVTGAGVDNEGYNDEAIDEALNDMDAAVDVPDTPSINAENGETDNKPTGDEAIEAPENPETSAEAPEVPADEASPAEAPEVPADEASPAEAPELPADEASPAGED